MEDEDILRGIGASEKEIADYQEMRRKLVKGYTYMVGVGGLLIPVLAIASFLEYLECLGYDLAFLLVFFALFLPVFFLSMNYMVLLFKTSKRFADMIEKTWLIWPGSQLLNSKAVTNFMIVGMVISFATVSFATILIIGDFAGETSIIMLSFIFLVILPAIPLIRKTNKKQGFTIERLFKSNVDEIANKLAISLRGEKKVIIKGRYNKRYQILLPDEKEIKLFVSNRADQKEFAQVSIMGVKMSNLEKTKKLILEVEKALE